MPKYNLLYFSSNFGENTLNKISKIEKRMNMPNRQKSLNIIKCDLARLICKFMN